jgi:8-oxo-dGTP diphosphatase
MTYTPPTVTVDGVIFRLTNGVLEVLLINRKKEPFKGVWALPGGYSSRDETTAEALHRVLAAKAGLDTGRLGVLEQLYTFDTKAHDPRGHAVSVVYLGLCRGLAPAEDDTTESPRFFPVSELPDLGYEHADIIQHAWQRLRGKVTYTNIIFALLPEAFTLSQLQAAYEAVLARSLDKRNFRKKFLGLDMIEPTTEYRKEGAHRPALLYRFLHQSLQTLSRSFD